MLGEKRVLVIYVMIKGTIDQASYLAYHNHNPICTQPSSLEVYQATTDQMIGRNHEVEL
jgi:hypothetical protein